MFRASFAWFSCPRTSPLLLHRTSPSCFGGSARSGFVRVVLFCSRTSPELLRRGAGRAQARSHRVFFLYPHQQFRKRSVAHFICRTPQLSTVSHSHGRIVHARPFKISQTMPRHPCSRLGRCCESLRQSTLVGEWRQRSSQHSKPVAARSFADTCVTAGCPCFGCGKFSSSQ